MRALLIFALVFLALPSPLALAQSCRDGIHMHATPSTGSGFVNNLVASGVPGGGLALLCLLAWAVIRRRWR